jgi:hypothetical protein
MPVPVYLNHFYLTLVPESYKAVKESSWLKQDFAPFEERTTARNDTSYTGIYFYGRNTYFEFFEAGAASGRLRGDSAVAFGVEETGALANMRKILPMQNTVTRRTPTGEPAWFHMGASFLGAPGTRFRTWVMEYHRDFLAQWYPELDPKDVSSLVRRNVLDRYVQKIGQSAMRDRALLKDVTSIEIALDEATRKVFVAMLQGFGYEVQGSTVKGPDISIRLIALNGSDPGIRKVTFSLQHGVTAHKVFGSSELDLKGREAVWTF